MIPPVVELPVEEPAGGGASVPVATPIYINVLSNGTIVTENTTALNFLGNGVSVVANGSTANITITAGGSTYSNSNVVSLMSAFGSNTVSTTGNITGGYILGNGSQLTGISAAVSVSKIESGLSNVQIASANANITMAVSTTSNVVVVSTTGITTLGSLTLNTGNAATTAVVNGAGNGVGNIGSSTGYFNRIFAVATSALYADVAERFESDELLDPGTVVELGGSKEITRSRVELSENVFGVISTRPAFTMNGGAGENDTHPAVAMTGRVPVNVTGIINKGDRLVSAGNGIARAAQPGEATAFNVIGRALVSKSTNDLGTVEAIVSIQI